MYSDVHFDCFSTPILITNFNRLNCLQRQIDWLLNAGYTNIHINDNGSSYAPLLEYYEQLKTNVNVSIFIQNTNYGHNGFIEYPQYQSIKTGFFVTTDPDIIPTENTPKNLIEILHSYLISHNRLKCGVALKIDDLPDHNPLKDEIIGWENQFWKDCVEDNVFIADIDTTFALNAPNTMGTHNWALRIGGDCACRHTTWYLDPNNLPDDEKYYTSSLNKNHSHWSSRI
jgi:hypothetical protein